jgi:hypothetical protein
LPKLALRKIEQAGQEVKKNNILYTIFDEQPGKLIVQILYTKLFMFTFQALAVEMGPNTRVNCIAPGFVPTRFTNFLTTNETIVSDSYVFSLHSLSSYLSTLLYHFLIILKVSMFYAIKESQYLALFIHKFLICDATAVA